MGTYLDGILDYHREQAANDLRSVDALIDHAAETAPTRGFAGHIKSRPPEELAVIAEFKRRSPSKGDLAMHLAPAEIAQKYELGGATCLSVLTDQPHFDGSPQDLQEARSACSLPVLRKDFTVDLRNICDARLMGADAVLLIAAALDDYQLKDFSALAQELTLDVLLEIHDEAEAERALNVGASLIGVNQRDLHTFVVDTERALRVARALPTEVLRVAESGIASPADGPVLAQAGFDALLVGEWLVTAEDPAQSVAALRCSPANANSRPETQ